MAQTPQKFDWPSYVSRKGDDRGETTNQRPLRGTGDTDPGAGTAVPGGKILENRQQHANLAEQMRRVEAVIKMLDPGYSLRAVSVRHRKANPWFKRGTIYRRAVDALRTATEPLTAREIADRVFDAANINGDSGRRRAYGITMARG
jgi:hypothetical protein